MEEIINMEQPSLIESEAVDVGEQNTQMDNHESTDDSVAGSNKFGKFKDATTLFEAYNNLQREFTKKSQQLSTMIKNQNNVENLNKTDKNIESSTNFDENIDKIADFQNAKLAENHDYSYKKSDWTSKVNSFLNSNNDAKQYASEISKLIISDKSLAQSPNCLEYAYAIVKSKNTKEPASYLTDQNFLEKNIYNNEKIKDKIIQDYLSSVIQKKEKNIKVITGQADNVSLTRPKDTPKNLKEASLILKKLLQ